MEKFCFEIWVEGALSNIWCDWFEGLELRQEGDQTLIMLTARDAALLYGVLGQLANLNIQLISVQRTAADRTEDL